MNKYIRKIPAILTGIMIFYISSLENPFSVRVIRDLADISTYINKNVLFHFCEFALLSFFILVGFNIKKQYVFIVSVCYALLDEIHQNFVPYRYFELFDIVMDTIGVIMGIISYYLLMILIKKYKIKKYYKLKEGKELFKK